MNFLHRHWFDQSQSVFPKRARMPATRKVPNVLMLTCLVGWLLLAGCNPVSRPADRFPADATQSDTTIADDTVRKQGNLLSAFFGLDNGLPRQSNQGICQGAGNADGMPVIFAQEVEGSTLQAGDFRVVTQSGTVGEIACVTLFPAVDMGELRTVLLVGEFGSASDDPPVTVEIVGNLLSLDGGINFKSAQITVTPLPPGPTLVMAELVPPVQWQLDKKGGPRGNGSGCPAGTSQIVRVVWAGGVVKGNGAEADDVEREAYKVTLLQQDGSQRQVAPFALADLDDGDNNHLLCLNQTGEPRSIDFPAGLLADPNGDRNPATSVAVGQ